MALVLVGKSASGKDAIRKELSNLNMQSVVSYTTRPPRNGEIDGIHYHFVSDSEFKQLNLFGIREYKVANGSTWYYGFNLSDLNSNSVLIVDPVGLRNLYDSKIPIVSFYIKVNEDILISRAMKRSGNINEINRRISADRRDFFFIEPRVDFSINNSQGSVKETAHCIYLLYQNFIKGANA